jgi:hypothetical protein
MSSPEKGGTLRAAKQTVNTNVLSLSSGQAARRDYKLSLMNLYLN